MGNLGCFQLLAISNNFSFVSAYATKCDVATDHKISVKYKNNDLLFTSLKAKLCNWHTVTSTHIASFKASLMVKPKVKDTELLMMRP